MTSQLSLFAPRPPPAEPLQQHPRPPPEPFRGFPGLDEIFKRRSEEEWAKVRAKMAERAAGAKPPAGPEPMPVESAPPPTAPVPEPCAECGGIGRWQGELGPAECWRCYGTGLEHPTPGDLRRAAPAKPPPAPAALGESEPPPEPAEVLGPAAPCVICRAPTTERAPWGGPAAMCPACVARTRAANDAVRGRPAR